MAERIWLDVPYADRDAAKAAGARWDPAARAWHAGPRADLAALARWAPLPVLLPGEDRGFGTGLFVDLVPASCWFTNVRTCVATGDWDRVRRMVYGRAEARCEACGSGPDPAAGLRLEAHERWAFDEVAGVQRLARLICLCSDCHAVTHFGLTAIRGRQEWALDHLQAVTGLDPEQAIAHVDAAFELWEARSARVWSLDLSMLTGAGIRLAVPPDAVERAAHAERTAAAHRDVAIGQPAETAGRVSVAGGNVAGHQRAAGGDRREDEERSMAQQQDSGRSQEHACGCSDPYGNGACDGPRVTVTEYDGFPPWMLTAPIEQIKFFGPNADELRAALLEIRAAAAAHELAHAPAAGPPVPAPADPRPPVVPSAARASPRARRGPWRRGQP